MRYLFVIAVLIVCVPQAVFAHATPVEMHPQSGERLATEPREIRIVFSERLEEGVSRIVVVDERGKMLSAGEADVLATNPRELKVPLSASGKEALGAYFVKWSVVSKDDGHFTKGQYAYFVGEGSVATSTPQVEVVQSSALPEAAAIAIELLGNSLLWGVLVFFALAVRPHIRRGAIESNHIARLYLYAVGVGVVLVLLGGGGHFYIKTAELAELSGISLADAASLYFATVSGTATVVRSAIALVIAGVVLLRGRAVMSAARITYSETAVFVGLIAFAYFRATVSHATANPFLPELSVFVNMAHLIGKDLWAGLLLSLSVAFLYRPLRAHGTTLLRATLRPIVWCFGLTGTTAAYIVWLHLNDFGNLTTTLWGERFALLLACGSIAAALLVSHILLYRFRPHLLSRFVPLLLAAECVAAVLVVFFSSLMIITSPPQGRAEEDVFSEHRGSVVIELARAPYEDAMARVVVRGAAATEPTVMLDASEESGLLIDLERRARGAYVFPLSLLTEGEEHRIDIRVAQEGEYDALASFTLTKEDLLGSAEKGRRSFGVFTAAMFLIGLSLLFVSAALCLCVRTAPALSFPATTRVAWVVGFAASLVLMAQLIEAGGWLLRNQFKERCLKDANAWHLMLPMRASVPTSERPAEGCMALGGTFHIADPAEYEYLSAPAASRLAFGESLTNVRAGVPTELSFSIEHEDGTPMLLSVAHERLVHVIIVSSDMREFYHVHPDDHAPLSPSQMRDASFTIPFMFRRGGEYMLAVDYVDGLRAESKTVSFEVAGIPQEEPELYPTRASFAGYSVELDAGLLQVGKPATLLYRMRKEGKDVVDMEPYLAAAMHVAAVRNDLGEFLHTHGEVHIPGNEPLPLTHASAHRHAPPPARFGPVIEAHPTFSSVGLYTVFGEFMHEGRVITTSFTVRVEE